MSSERVLPIGGLLDEAAERLRTAGVPKPKREANRLWAWQQRAPAGQAVLDRDRHADGAARSAFEAAVARRVAGEPMAYVLGWTGFRNLELRTDRRALIPRPESELVVEHGLRLARTGRALDLCTGTGCLGLALAQEGSFELVVGADCSAEALALAGENARATGLPLRLVRGDLGGGLRGAGFELIVSNPPYLTDAEHSALDRSVRDWEPRLALASGPDGLEVSRAILTQGMGLAVPGGRLVMELDSNRAGATAELARASGWGEVQVLDDLFGRARYLVARRGLEA